MFQRHLESNPRMKLYTPWPPFASFSKPVLICSADLLFLCHSIHGLGWPRRQFLYIFPPYMHTISRLNLVEPCRPSNTRLRLANEAIIS